MSGSVRSAVVRLSADVSGLVAGYQQAKVATTDLAKSGLDSAARHRTALRELGNQAGLMGAAVGAGVLFATKRFADFDQEMSRAQAATGATGDSMDQLRSLALDLGAKSQFSAGEAAQGITNLAKAGVSTTDIMGGALKGSLDLAAAGELSVASAAEDTATALTQFHLSGSQATHVADLLAASANMAQGEVSDMATALNYAGIPAANLGVSIEQTTGTLALFAKNGLIGEQAGTTLRGMLSSLTSPSAQARKEMEALGITVFDAQGKFLGLDGVAGQLQTKMAGLTQEERANALGRIFGNAQIQGANILYREGAGAVDKWTAGINKSGYAAQNAATKTDNLKGDIERLGGALDSLLITSAQGGNGPLRSTVQGLTHVIDVANKLPAPVKGAALALAGLAAVTGGGIFIASRVITGINDTRKAIDELGWSAGKLPPKLTAAAGAAAKIGTALAIVSIADQAFDLSTTTDEIQRLSNVVDASAGDSIPKQIDATMAKIQQLQDELPSITGFGGMKIPMQLDLGITTLHPTDQAAKTAELIDGLKNHLADLQAQLQVSQLSAGDFSGQLGIFGDLLGQAIPPLGGVAKAAGKTANGIGQVGDAAGGATGQVDAFKGALSALNGFFDKRDAIRNYQAAIDDFRKSFKRSAGFNLDVDPGRQNQAKLDAIAQGAATVASHLHGVARTEFVQNAIGQLRAMAQNMHLPQSQVDVLIAKLRTLNHTDASPTAKVIDHASNTITGVIMKLNALDGKVSTSYLRTVEIHSIQTQHVSTAGGRASGGPVDAGKSYWVGERGPEIVTFAQSGRVIPNHQIDAPLNAVRASGSGGTGGRGLRIEGPVEVTGKLDIATGRLVGTMRAIAREEINDDQSFNRAMAGGRS